MLTPIRSLLVFFSQKNCKNNGSGHAAGERAVAGELVTVGARRTHVFQPAG